MILQTRFLWGSNIVFAEIACVSSVCSRDLMSISPSHLLMLRKNLKASSEQGWNGDLKGRAGDFLWKRCTWSSCKSERRLSPPFPPISRSIWYLEKKYTIVSLFRISGTFQIEFWSTPFVWVSYLKNSHCTKWSVRRKLLHQNIICFCIEMVPRLHIARASNFWISLSDNLAKDLY